MDTGIQKDWLETVAAIVKPVCGAIVALYGLTKLVLPRLAAIIVRKSFVRYFTDFHQLAKDMDTIRCLVRAERVVIFSGHNCGGLPEIHKPFFVSSLHWSVDADFLAQFPAEGYQDIPVDDPYVTLLMDLSIQGQVHADPERMAENSIIARFYRNEGVRDSYWFYLAAVDNQLSFISIASYTRRFTPGEVTDMEIAVNRMRKRFK